MYNIFIMFNRKDAKLRAKESLKKHYAVFVIACLLAAFIGSNYTSTFTGAQTKTTEEIVVENLAGNASTNVGEISTDEVLTLLFKGEEEKAIEACQHWQQHCSSSHR